MFAISMFCMAVVGMIVSFMKFKYVIAWTQWYHRSSFVSVWGRVGAPHVLEWQMPECASGCGLMFQKDITSISGLVVEYIVAIDVTRLRFPADALIAVRWVTHTLPNGKDCTG